MSDLRMRMKKERAIEIDLEKAILEAEKFEVLNEEIITEHENLNKKVEEFYRLLKALREDIYSAEEVS